MMTTLALELKSAIIDLVSDIIAGRYAEIVSDGRIGRLTADELTEAIRLYGRKLIPLPDEAWHFVQVYPVTGDSSALAVDVDMVHPRRRTQRFDSFADGSTGRRWLDNRNRRPSRTIRAS